MSLKIVELHKKICDLMNYSSLILKNEHGKNMLKDYPIFNEDIMNKIDVLDLIKYEEYFIYKSNLNSSLYNHNIIYFINWFVKQKFPKLNTIIMKNNFDYLIKEMLLLNFNNIRYDVTYALCRNNTIYELLFKYLEERNLFYLLADIKPEIFNRDKNSKNMAQIIYNYRKKILRWTWLEAIIKGNISYKG